MSGYNGVEVTVQAGGIDPDPEIVYAHVDAYEKAMEEHDLTSGGIYSFDEMRASELRELAQELRVKYYFLQTYMLPEEYRHEEDSDYFAAYMSLISGHEIDVLYLSDGTKVTNFEVDMPMSEYLEQTE